MNWEDTARREGAMDSKSGPQIESLIEPPMINHIPSYVFPIYVPEYTHIFGSSNQRV